MRYARTSRKGARWGSFPEPWDSLDDSACGEVWEVATGASQEGWGDSPSDSVFSLEDSALEFFALTEEERAKASARSGSGAFHAIVAPALPASEAVEGAEPADAGDGETAEPEADAAAESDAAEAARAAAKRARAALRARRRYIAAGLALVAAATVGSYAGYTAGQDSAFSENPLRVQAGQNASIVTFDAEAVAVDQQARDANIAARYDAIGVDIAAADRVPADEMVPITVDPVAVEPVAEVQRLTDVNASPGSVAVLDVPLVNQLDDADGGRAMTAGCEVASLAMLLRHSGVDVTKEQLQEAMPTVPMIGEDGLYGNPNRAFVGEMAGDAQHVGYSVYHGPVADLARGYLANRSFKVFDLTGQSFTTMLKEVADGNPCWVITTTTMAPDLLLESWQTAEGPVDVNWMLHSVVVTGFDDFNVFVNDPYGYEQNVPYERTAFEQAWKLMGSQCVTIVPVN